MAGTKLGGAKVKATNLANDPDFYRKLGRLGGLVSNPNKGFGSNRKLAVEMGKRSKIRRVVQ